MSAAIGPRPLILVHLSTSILGTACGRVAGQRRFDDARGTFVQDSAHLSLRESSGGPGRALCTDCLHVAKSQSPRDGEPDTAPDSRHDARHALPR